MASRDIKKSFLEQFSSYEGCIPPGVRLPEINIESKYYKNLDLNEDISNFDFLKTICEEALNKKIKKGHKELGYEDRLNYELNTLNELGFVDYILLNWDIINFCYENGIPTGPGRGSAAGSLVLFLIGVTKVDPIKYDLFLKDSYQKVELEK